MLLTPDFFAAREEKQILRFALLAQNDVILGVAKDLLLVAASPRWVERLYSTEITEGLGSVAAPTPGVMRGD